MVDRPISFITRVRLKDFKSIAQCDVKLGPLSVVVGPNASGKTNFLNSFAFLSRAVNLGTYSGSAELINHILASGSPHAVPILRPPSPPARRLTEDNPHPAAGDLRYTGHQNAWQTPDIEAEP